MSRKQPNIVFFFTDDQRFDTIHALGNRQIITPTLDWLVERGTTFNHAYIMGGTSGAVCMPSRAMLHSSRTLFHLDNLGQSIPDEHALLGETLREGGYQTFGTGKWHNGKKAYARSFTHGDDIFFGGMGDHWNVPAFHFDPSGKYEARLPYCTDCFASKELKYLPGDHMAAATHSSEIFCDAAIRFLETRPDDRSPFFMYVSFMAPHDPRTMPDEYQNMYDPDQIELPPNFLPVHPFDNGELRIRDEKLALFPRTPGEMREHIADYYAMITHADAQMGRVVDKLREQGLLDDTIFIFAGDNGLALGQHGLMGKQSNYEHAVHVPLVMAGPGIPTAEKRDAFCYLIDIFPTLCELASLSIPGSVEGKSLVPVLADPAESLRSHLLFAYKGIHRAIRDARWKLIEYVVNGERCSQLFDLQDDPWEQNNLAACESCREHLDRLRERLREWQTCYDDNHENSGKIFWDAWQ